MMSTFHLVKGVVYERTEFGSVILNKTTGEYWELNEVATEAFELALAGMVLDAVISTLSVQYDVERKQIESDLRDLFEFAIEAKVLKEAD